jgi:hypothetical protein
MRSSLAFLFAAALATPGVAKVKSYDMGEAGVLALDLPAGWTLTRQGPEASGGAALVVAPPAGVPLHLLLTPYPVPPNEDPEGAAREFARKLASHLQPNAVETSLPLKSIEGPGARGYFVSATDKTVTQPSMTSFKYVDQGAIALGPVLLEFTSLTNLAEGSARAQALDVLRNARISPPLPPPAPERSESGTVQVPATWNRLALAIDLPGFDLNPIEVRDDGFASRLYGDNPSTKLVVTVYVERAEGAQTTLAYRTKCWQALQKSKDAEERDPRFTQRGPIALLEYSIPDLEGMPIDQRHVNAYLVDRGLQIDVHLSKMLYTHEDQALFDKILSSIRIVASGPDTLPAGS